VSSSLFFLLSGEHDTLPAAEVLAILESERFDYHDIKLAPKLLTLKADRECVDAVVARAGMCEAAGRLIIQCRDDSNEIMRAALEVSFSDFLEAREVFSVRVRRVFGSSRHLDKMQLQSKVGSLILNSVPGSKVELRNPEKEFIGIVCEGLFSLGQIAARHQDRNVNRRRPKERPAFHPSTMKPRLARCFVNLARARIGEVLLDPFCGVGGILIEAGIMGCRAVGTDCDPRMVHKAMKNIRHFAIEPGGVVVADARKSPYLGASSIATDPPYGRGASTMGSDPGQLLKEFLAESYSMLPQGGFLCLASPWDIGARRLGLEAGFSVVESHLTRVHRSLVREIVVFSRGRVERKERVSWNSYS